MKNAFIVTHEMDITPKVVNGKKYYTLTIFCNGVPVKDIFYDSYQNMALDADRATAIIADKIHKGELPQ